MKKFSHDLEKYRDLYAVTFREALELAISICGGVVALSKEANIDYSTIHRWQGGDLGRRQPHQKLIDFLKKQGE